MVQKMIPKFRDFSQNYYRRFFLIFFNSFGSPKTNFGPLTRPAHLLKINH